jgi:hypothetical protein
MATSSTVFDNPELFESSVQALIKLTQGGLLVWRISRHNSKRLVAFPSSEIKTPEDYELKIGRKLAGATVGYPIDTSEEDDFLWLSITDGNSEKHYIEYSDAPTSELRSLLKQLHTLAKSECDKGSLTPLLSGD